MKRSGEALTRFIKARPKSILDVGSGKGEHAKVMRDNGLSVTTVDLGYDPNFKGDYLEIDCGVFDGIWCSHVLEHSLNVHSFLSKIKNDLAPEGLLALTVPPMRNRLVGGHINLFTEATLIYNLILAGFDCSRASVGVYGYNISVLVKNTTADLPSDLVYDNGDIERLAKFFPWSVSQGINSQLGSVRW